MKEFLTKERKVEDIILLILSVVACLLAVLIFAGKLTVKLGYGISPNAFAWVLLILGLVSLIISLCKIIKLNNKKGNK